ncbi:MAG: hypothetical protein A3I88_01530 [Candidatus Portnoybacteria bacterium RIFCSPLOWO2_12_FULL_39_9]|uniref:Uncharacterized protein n=1 Tax=Candidatus Portnoybacteria bacterium RIFCSPHIGHO2_12_FULL_38_9 TaxID=1801997 RepID=A0A1G2FFR4_9BACT|nr:MAG: hypothetical protein A2646_02070 [Candidatus Portnoybacteria bacterium RIFCSPHIGHO2_02_FULL_39_12]OGZ36893.1 MAG: hypothetical protein A3J64_03610 [Candidatus Portnoybacteria bacterium RIFCSPHIGHO2_12_FULL_38_9]OGZ38721.1 MAG: hypothetical protein A3F21_01360 [Candidatus Portnoybacteria bacterium RIFCSPLOWO2_01_FULL_38_39]OGZ40575.1 MAG: hypothetical protein A3I88_01530 [Candidatus Portnoybacteria bacterium RIFCSPLOWO2_12_FULL_39_9]
MKYYPVKKLDELTSNIVELMPPLESFFLTNDNIKEVSKKLYAYDPVEIYKRRQKYFISLLQQKIKRLFSEGERKTIALFREEKSGLAGGVVDHHGILNHPVLIGVNIVPHFFRMFNRSIHGDILTFATGNVPLNDPFHRRGFMVRDRKVNLFPKNDKNKIVFGLSKYDFKFIESLQRTHQWKFHSSEVQKFLEKVQKLISEIDFSTCETLGDQITKINFHLWPLLFNTEARDGVSKLISIEYDDIVIEYLLYVLNNDPKSFIYQMLFDNDFQEKTLDYFNRKTGAWNSEKDLGTHFFWGISANHEHLRMKLENGKLRSNDNSFAIEWSIDGLSKALRNRRILPGMFLKFSLLLFYMGLKPFAGYGSGNYLAVLQKDMIEFLQDIYPQEVDSIKSITVNNITSVPVLLQRGSDGKIKNYFAFDIMFDGGLPKGYFGKINSVPLKYFMAPNLNAIYDYAFNLYGQGKKADIVAISEDYEPLLREVI